MTGTMSGRKGHQTGRIAKNSVVLFVRMFVLMIVNLYVVRVLMQRLGTEDFGIFNAVAGVVLTLSCVSSVLLVSTQRFYSYAQGEGKDSGVKRIFSTSVNINLGFSLLVIIVFETIGVWFLNYKMQIPTDRIVVANWIFQFALFSFVCTILQIPFSSMIIANEDMHWYAVISTAECLLRLVVALLIGTIAVDRLGFYGSGLLVVAIIVLLLYIGRTRTKYEECRYVLVKERKIYKCLLSFSGWTFFGSIANVGLIQGNAIMLNVFFGPIVNAFFGIAIQIYNAFMSLGNSVIVAIRPVMIRAYAQGDHNYLTTLFNAANKAIFFLMLMVAFPLISNMPLILDKWLGKNDPQMIIFARLIIVYVGIIMLNNPITIIMQAMGKVKQYHLPVESVTLLSLPLSYLLFRFTNVPVSVFYSMIALALAAHIVRIICLMRYYEHFSVKNYILQFILRALLIAIAVGMLEYALTCNTIPGWSQMAMTTALSCITIPLLAYLVGITRDEKEALIQIANRVLKRKV